MRCRRTFPLVAFLLLTWGAAPSLCQPRDRWRAHEDTPYFSLTLPNAGTIDRWRIARAPGGVTLQVWIGKYQDWYLNYDHRGKDAAVLLTPEPGPGCVWVLSEVRRGPILDRRGEGSQYIAATITAAEGPMRGWYLTPEARARLRKERGEIKYRIDLDDLHSGK
jgi:hypothetical protein